MNQIPLRDWPLGLEFHAAVLAVEAPAIERILKTKIEHGTDDLDDFVAVIFTVADRPAALRQYRSSTNKGFDLILCNTVPNIEAVLQSVLDMLGLVSKDVLWRHPRAGGELRRPFVDTILGRLRESSPKIQILHGPRQVGKTTGANQILADWTGPGHYISADSLEGHRPAWLLEQWQSAIDKGPGCLLIIDEYQKISNWSHEIKALWDSHAKRTDLRLLLLGSTSPDLLQHNESETLLGRFEKTYVAHWTYPEMKAKYEFDLKKFFLFGGYPGSATFVNDFSRWLSYITESVFKPAINDIQTTRPVRKVDELQRMFDVLCKDAGADISFRKLLEEAHSSGNTDTVKNYLDLFEKVFLFKVLSKYKGPKQRSSSPKIIPLCNALHTYGTRSPELKDDETHTRLLEVSVGQDLLQMPDHLSYWKLGNKHLDFVIEIEGQTFGIEIKRSPHSLVQYADGIEAFRKEFPKARLLIISEENYERWSLNPLGYLHSAAV